MHTEQTVWSNLEFKATKLFKLSDIYLPVLLWGPLFVGAPVRPNVLNMPKSASVNTASSHSPDGSIMGVDYLTMTTARGVP